MPALRTRDTTQSRCEYPPVPPPNQTHLPPALEVTTDAPQPPTFAIISPTPRAFTFPTTHNLTDHSPYSSPSSSPFEADLRTLASSCTSASPLPLMRTLSPDSPFRSSSPSTSSSSHKRRKSSCSSDIERRPKKGDEDYIKRPENAFILFRRRCCEERQQAQEEAAAVEGPAKKQRQADLSKTISQQWKGLSSEERQYWENLAKEKKKEHEQLYPNYVYRPQRAKDRDGRSKSKKPKGRRGDFEHETDSETMTFVLPTVPRHHGRSASAPTPPPYQSIQIPNVYQMTPSCPTSPSLLPMISRRSAHPGHPDDALSNFDFLPSDNSFMPPSFGQAGQFEASLQVCSKKIGLAPLKLRLNSHLFQSSEFLRNMFNTSGQVPQRNPAPSHAMPQGHQVLLPSHHIFAASSSSVGSSGPPSPTSGPYTPTMLTESFSHLTAGSPQQQHHRADGCGSELQSQAELDLQMEMQYQQDLQFASYSWETGSVWANAGSEMLLGDDFDLSAIPPIELGIPKFSDELEASGAGMSEFGHHEYNQTIEGHHYHDDGQNIDGLLAFDEMMAGHGF